MGQPNVPIKKKTKSAPFVMQKAYICAQWEKEVTNTAGTRCSAKSGNIVTEIPNTEASFFALKNFQNCFMFSFTL